MAEETTIKVMDNGPLYVEGSFKVLTPDGKEIAVDGNKAALCRCGASEKKPFCDGAHKGAGFSHCARVE